MIVVVGHGDEELARRAADLAGRPPDALALLARIAYNIADAARRGVCTRGR